jgi:hypothetical protein
MLKADAFREALCAACSDIDVTSAASLLTPDPLAPPAAPLNLSEESYGRIPRVYIKTLRDRGLTPPLQNRMVTVLSCQKTISMETSHSPLFSAPEMPVDHLRAI